MSYANYAKLADILGPWSRGSEPLYGLLAVALQRAILSGDIAVASRLPSERQLAQQLAVSRTTVVTAYDLLRQDGWIERRMGSGTWVCAVAGAHTLQRQDELAGSLARSPFYDALLASKGVTIDLTKANVAPRKSAKPGAFSLSDQELTRLLDGQGAGYAPLGLPALRQAIADRYTSQGLPTSQDQIMITSGAQQAIYLLATLFVHRGDTVLIENPTYAGAIEAFRATGGRLVPVHIEGKELHADLLQNLVKLNLPQIIYVTPTCNNPTGRVMSKEERRILAEISCEYRLPVLEDNTLADLVFNDCVPASIAAYADEAPVISVDSLSKLFWSGLRVGWVRAPSSVVARLARLKAVADLGNSLVSQAIAVRLIEQADELRASRHRELSTRLEFLFDLLHEQLPEWTWTPPSGGPYLWVRLPCGDAQEFAQMALRYGVLITPGASMSVDGSHTAYLRLPFYMEPTLLQEGVYRLAAAWETFTRLPSSEHQAGSVIV